MPLSATSITKQHLVVHRQPSKTHAALVQQILQALHKVRQARNAFDEAKQRFGQHFTTGVQLDKCVAQMCNDAAGAAELGGITGLCVDDIA